MRIVVADDEPDIRRLVAFALCRRGYEVAEAAAGDAALDLVRTEVPDLVVLDVMMPGMNGTAVARALGEDERTAGIPVLLLDLGGLAPGRRDRGGYDQRRPRLHGEAVRPAGA